MSTFSLNLAGIVVKVAMPAALAVTAAQASADAAETFASTAQAAAGAALAAAGAVPAASTAAGLATTSVGETFYVLAGGVGTTYRHDAGPVATQIGKFVLDPTADGAADQLGIKRAEAGAVSRKIAAVVGEMMLSVKDFGAKGDNATDDTAAITSALAAAKLAGARLIFPAGIYLHSGLSATDLRFVTIEGVARGSFGSAGAAGVRLVCTTAGNDHIRLTNPHGVEISRIQFETHSAVTPTAGAVISLIGTNGGAASCEISKVRIEKHFNGVLIDGVSNSEFMNSQVRRGLGNYAVCLIGGSKRLDQIRLKGIITDSEIGTGSSTQDGFLIDTDVHTVWVQDCSALNGRYGFILAGAISPEFIYFQAAEAENCHSHGFLIEKADHLRMLEVYASDNTGNGITFGSTFTSTARLISPCARANNENGVLMNGSGGIDIVAPRIGGNSAGSPGTSHGIAVGAGVSNWSVIGGKVGGDVNLQGTGGQSRGIQVNEGASNNYTIIGVDLQGNQSGGISDGGTGTSKRIRDNRGAADYGYSRGSATVTAGNTTGVFAHGLGVTPTRVLLTPRGNPGAHFWATANSTQAIVNLAAAAGASVTFDVEAIL